MFTQRSVIKSIKKFSKEIKLTGIHLNKVILFGSYAKNTQGKWSDIDVALIADEFNGVGFNDIGLFSKVLIKYPDLNLQPHTYNTNDFSSAKDPIVAEILKTGIEITS